MGMGVSALKMFEKFGRSVEVIVKVGYFLKYPIKQRLKMLLLEIIWLCIVY